MNYKMRVLIKRPDEEYGHVCNISNRLENLQKTVGGYIEVVQIARSADGKPILMVCNEEGKLRNLEQYVYRRRGNCRHVLPVFIRGGRIDGSSADIWVGRMEAICQPEQLEMSYE